MNNKKRVYVSWSFQENYMVYLYLEFLKANGLRRKNKIPYNHSFYELFKKYTGKDRITVSSRLNLIERFMNNRNGHTVNKKISIMLYLVERHKKIINISMPDTTSFDKFIARLIPHSELVEDVLKDDFIDIYNKQKNLTSVDGRKKQLTRFYLIRKYVDFNSGRAGNQAIKLFKIREEEFGVKLEDYNSFFDIIDDAEKGVFNNNVKKNLMLEFIKLIKELNQAYTLGNLTYEEINNLSPQKFINFIYLLTE